MGANRGELTPKQKQVARLEAWQSAAGIPFRSPIAAERYQKRVQRIIDVINVREPDRVPAVVMVGFFPAFYAGMTPREIMYDPEKLAHAWNKYTQDFDPDVYFGAGGVFPGKAFEILDCKQFRWPGHGLPENVTYQFVEDEYMRADEYDAFLCDPTDYAMRVYMPRVFGALAPLARVAPLASLGGPGLGPGLVSYAGEGVETALQAIVSAAKESARWFEAVLTCDREALSMGYPGFVGGGCEAPFDVLGDAFRGTAGVMLDMFRQKDTLLRALDQLAEAQIRRAVSGARDGASPLIFMPLHKGADGFMSAEQFETFYWPSLKRVCLGLIEEGLVPWLFAEGTYDSRLETVTDLPRQSVIWYFDRTDMKKAKDTLGRTQCIMGNIPLSLMYTGTPRQIEDYCQGLIQVAGGEGGFILSPGAAIDEGKADNIRAVMNAARRYGQYPLV
jgi:hypothetical protein